MAPAMDHGKPVSETGDAQLWYEVRAAEFGNDESVTRERGHEAAAELARRHPSLPGAEHYNGPPAESVPDLDAQAAIEENARLQAELEALKAERDAAVAAAAAGSKSKA